MRVSVTDPSTKTSASDETVSSDEFVKSPRMKAVSGRWPDGSCLAAQRHRTAPTNPAAITPTEVHNGQSAQTVASPTPIPTAERMRDPITPAALLAMVKGYAGNPTSVPSRSARIAA